MKLTIKRNEIDSVGSTPKSFCYDVYIDDYKLGDGVRGINLDMDAAELPVLTIKANPSVIDIDTNVLAKMKDEWRKK
jgi:hypothetical protein